MLGGLILEQQTVLFSGVARLPKETAEGELYKVLTLVTLVNVRTGIIIDSECTLATQLERKFLTSIIVGSSLANGVEAIIDKVEDVYQGTSKKAITSALRGVNAKYREYMNQKPLGNREKYYKFSKDEKEAV